MIDAVVRGPAWLACIALAIACAPLPVPPKPLGVEPGWARDLPVFVPPIHIVTSQPVGIGEHTIVMAAMDRVVPQELAAAGFQMVKAPEGDALTLQLTFTDTVTLRGELRAGAAPVATFDADARADDLDCILLGFKTSSPDDNCRCLVREIVRKATRSPQITALVGKRAAVQSAAAPKPAPAPAPAAAPPAPAAPKRAWRGKLAVLDLHSYSKDITADNARYFTDLVRAGTLDAAPQLEVMTRENVIVLLQASGRKLEDCEGECEVDTGRRLGADFVVSGEIQKVGNRLKISLRLHDTHDGRLLASSIASGNSIEQLDDATAKAVQSLYARSPGA